MTRLLRAALCAAILAPVAACGLPGSDREPPRLFVLSPKSTFAPDLPKVDWQLTVDTPIAEAGLNSAKIALKHNALSLEYYARAAWTDTAPLMVQTLIVESFENTGRIVAVGRQSIVLRGDYLLVTELREFQAEYEGKAAPKVRVRLNAKLVRMPQRVIVANHTSESVIAATDGSLEAVVHAFDEALGKVLKRIVEWTLTAVPPDRPSAGLRDEVAK
jgi:cholesterol transport system auxiliary component